MNDLDGIPPLAGKASPKNTPKNAPGDEADPPTARVAALRRPLSVALLGLLILAGASMGGYWISNRQDAVIDVAAGPVANSEPATPPGESTADEPRTAEVTADGGAPDEPATGVTVAKSSLRLDLDNFVFSISGVVPTQEVADAIEAAVRATYGQHGASDLHIDPAAESEPWLSEIPFIVQNFHRILDGSLTIGEGGVEINGRSPNQSSIDFLTDALSTNSGFPELAANGLDVVRLNPSKIEAVAAEGVITVRGVVPSQTVRDAIVADIVGLYGDDNVIDEVVVDGSTFARFDLIRFGDNIEFFKQADDYEIGIDDDGFYIVLGEGISFAASSAELSRTAKRLLQGFPELLERNTLDLNIVGHTDDIGSEPDNLALSEARAGAVARFLSEAGVDPSRLVVIGAGETEPIAPNSTVEGRATNRRVVLTMGFEG